MNWNNITQSKEVIDLIKQREAINDKIRLIDEAALINYELEALNIPHVVNSLPEPLGEMKTLGGIKYTDKDYSDWRKSNYATLSEYLQSIS